jgi:uncharacterized protein YjiS (DUF1127 family)
MFTFLLKSLRSLSASFTEWQHRQQAIAELASLDDRSLADMGINRSDIPYIMSQVAYDREPAKSESAIVRFQRAA